MRGASYEMLSDPLMQPDEVDLAPTIRDDEMELKEEIGRGGMSRIFLYYLKKDDSMVVLKTLSGTVTGRDLTYLRTEASILANVQHDNIIRTYGMTQTRFGFGLVMEYMSNGSYIDFFGPIWDRERKTKELEETIAPLKIQILAQVVDAMEYLHRPHKFPSSSKSKSILHLDLKRENVLLDQNLHAKICDFGLSRMSTLTGLRTSTTMNNGGAAGTPGFIAPEWLKNPRCRPSKKCDVYSFGILKYTVLTDLLPYEDFDFSDFSHFVHHVVTENCRPDISNISSAYPRYLTELMKSCWDSEPAQRPSFAKLKIAMQTVKEHIHNENVAHAVDKVMRLHSRSHSNTSQPDDPMGYSPMGYSPMGTSPKDPISSLRTNSTTSQPINAEGPSPMGTSPKDTTAASWTNSDTADANVLLPSPLVTPEGNPPAIGYRVAPFEMPFSSIKKILLGVALVSILVAVISLGAIIPRINQPVDECPPVMKPRHGNANCVNGTTDVAAKCYFTCNDGYAIIGSDTTLCSGGRWTSKEPSCGVACNFPEISNGEMKCTNETFQNSSCSIACNNHRVIKGKSVIVCLENSSWSDPIPACVCPTCSVGDNCEHSTRWQLVKYSLTSLHPLETISVSYGKNVFVCTAHLPSLSGNLQITWTGLCIDKDTGAQVACSNFHTSPSGSADAAAASLIRNLTASGIYSEPCDVDKMPTDC